MTLSPIALHLLSCHVPFVGGMFALALLLYAIRRGDPVLARAADYAVIGVGAGCGVAWATGPASLTALQDWIDPAAQAFADRHEGLGEFSMIFWALASFVAVYGIFLARASRPVPRWRSPVLLALVVLGLGLAAWAGYEGGRIRHDELRHGVDTTAIAQDGLSE